MQNSEKPHGCLMLYFNTKYWQNLLNCISDEDLYVGEGETDQDFGKEREMHSTILYGFNHYNIPIKNLRKYALPLNTIKVIIKDISIFSNSEFDVLKFGVESQQLSQMNKTYRDNFSYDSDFPGYEPHVTIAYLLPGLGKKYINLLGTKLNCNVKNNIAYFSKPYTINPDKYIYSFDYAKVESFRK